MIDLFFVDANVFVYARDARYVMKRERAKAWLARLWMERIGRTSAQALSEYYVTVTRKLKPPLPAASAWDDVCALWSWKPQSVDEALFRHAREFEDRCRLSWWDSLIVAAAELQGCSILLSEGFQDGGVYGSVTVRSPFTLGVSEPLAANEARPSLIAGRRSRGRPKKLPAVRPAA